MQIGKYDPPNDRLISESAKYAQALSGACHHNPPILSHSMADKPKKLLDQVRDKLRLKNYSYATEKTYIGWMLYALLETLQVRQLINRHCPEQRDVDHGTVAIVLVLNRLMLPLPLYQ
ncbi:MAG: hypothetical protein ACKO4U_11560, partial [Caldilinea sp.]